jgi:hypothetical protein
VISVVTSALLLALGPAYIAYVRAWRRRFSQMKHAPFEFAAKYSLPARRRLYLAGFFVVLFVILPLGGAGAAMSVGFHHCSRQPALEGWPCSATSRLVFMIACCAVAVPLLLYFESVLRRVLPNGRWSG